MRWARERGGRTVAESGVIRPGRPRDHSSVRRDAGVGASVLCDPELAQTRAGLQPPRGLLCGGKVQVETCGTRATGIERRILRQHRWRRSCIVCGRTCALAAVVAHAIHHPPGRRVRGRVLPEQPPELLAVQCVDGRIVVQDEDRRRNRLAGLEGPHLYGCSRSWLRELFASDYMRHQESTNLSYRPSPAAAAGAAEVAWSSLLGGAQAVRCSQSVRIKRGQPRRCVAAGVCVRDGLKEPGRRERRQLAHLSATISLSS